MDIKEAAITPISTLVGAGMGMATANWQDKRQLKQQEKLQSLQMKGQKEMGQFNKELAMQMWKDTNFAEQRRQMEKAGLNIGLMYEGGGPGGTTQGAGQGNVSGATAAGASGELGMGMQLGLQAQMMQAQIEATKAQTQKTKVETAKTAGVDTEKVTTETKAILQATTNAELQAKIMEYDKQLREIEANVQGKSQAERIKQIQTATEKLVAETRSAKAQGNIDEASQNEVIKGIQLANEATTAGITQTEAQTRATETGIKATEAGIEQTKQNTRNLAQDEINKMLANAMKAAGIEPTDNMAVRMLQRWLGENDVSMKTVSDKMQAIGAWLKGQNGTQNMERLKEILTE